MRKPLRHYDRSQKGQRDVICGKGGTAVSTSRREDVTCKDCLRILVEGDKFVADTFKRIYGGE